MSKKLVNEFVTADQIRQFVEIVDTFYRQLEEKKDKQLSKTDPGRQSFECQRKDAGNWNKMLADYRQSLE